MKNRSIRFTMTLWFTIALVVIVGVSFLAVRWASSAILRKTVRDYLIGAVEENVDKIDYISDDPAKNGTPDEKEKQHIRFRDGYLQIDADFLDVVNDVYIALYDESGEMLYGENPLAQEMGKIPFRTSYTWSTDVGEMREMIYDRKLNIELPTGEELWLRGIVSEAQSVEQLADITRITLFILPILVALAVIAGYLLAGRMLQPIREIEDAAGRISAGSDLKERIDLGEGDDELHRLADVFNAMFDRLDQSFATERQFTSDASHELRTPMSVILAQCEVALDEELTGEEYRNALRTIRRQGARMNGLINDMLDYTRMEQRAEDYKLEPFDFSEMVRDTAEQMALLRTNGITLDMEIEDGLQVRGNQMLLRRLLQNLISNAYRYGKEDGRIHVTLSHKGEGKLMRAVLAVEDDGIGISKEDQAKIFDRFYRSDASRTVRGTGLGLSMVRKIAQIHRGKIRVESEPGQGSKFIFEILSDSNVSLI